MVQCAQRTRIVASEEPQKPIFKAKLVVKSGPGLSQGEMETVRGAFQAQLASAMDTLLAAALCEIAKIFESCLGEHQAALLQKTNEISVLKCELEKVERRCAESEINNVLAEEKTTSESENRVKQEPETVNISTDKVTLCLKGQNLTGIKEEVNSYEVNESKQETNDSQSNLQLPTNQQVSLSIAQPKTEPLHWDESNVTALQLHEEEAPSPLSLSPKVCSDTGRTEVWLQGLNTTQESAIENLPSNEPIWSGPLRRRSVFGVDETLSEDNGTLLSQESENSASSSGIIQAVQRGERGPKNHSRHGSTFRSRDRPQPNFHPFVRRNIECHRPADSSRPYSCPYCAKCFAYPSHQRRHLLRHTGVRLHLCQFCDKRFLTTSELTVHTRTHTGERPFGCGQCGKRFARSGNLRAHQRDVHLGKRPFACAECGKKFAHKGNLRVHHHRVHQGQR